MRISGSTQRSRNKTPSVHIHTAHCIQFCSTFADNIVCVPGKTASSNKRINDGVGLGISMRMGASDSVLVVVLKPEPREARSNTFSSDFARTCTYADGMGHQRLLCASDRTCCGSDRPKCLLSLLVYMFMMLL